ncbi:Malto-oligosyltrehalose trehalohydrolase [Balamuthia mandrillaris]
MSKHAAFFANSAVAIAPYPLQAGETCQITFVPLAWSLEEEAPKRGLVLRIGFNHWTNVGGGVQVEDLPLVYRKERGQLWTVEYAVPSEATSVEFMFYEDKRLRFGGTRDYSFAALPRPASCTDALSHARFHRGATLCTEEAPLGFRVKQERSKHGGAVFRLWLGRPVDTVELVGSFGHTDDDNRELWSVYLSYAKPGDEYKYRINQREMVTDPYARRIRSRVFNAVLTPPPRSHYHHHLQHSSFVRPPLNEMVIYELHVGSLSREGTFAGAKRFLPKIRSLGVNMIELMPIHLWTKRASFDKSKWEDSTKEEENESYVNEEHGIEMQWGYGPCHLFAVSPIYGTPEDFADFVETAHQLGLGVILDVVYNHLSAGHLLPASYFYYDHNQQSSEEDMDQNQELKGAVGDASTDGEEQEAKPDVIGDIRHTPWGPRPHFGLSGVRRMILDNVDGIRVDGSVTIRRTHWEKTGFDIEDGWTLLQKITATAASLGAFSMVEDLQNDSKVVRDGSARCLGFDAQWEEVFYNSIRDALCFLYPIHVVEETIKHRFTDCSPSFQRIIYIENHDKVTYERFPVRISRAQPTGWLARKKTLLASCVLLTTPSIPMLFMGQEWFECTSFYYPQGNGRTFCWSEIEACYRQEGDEQEDAEWKRQVTHSQTNSNKRGHMELTMRRGILRLYRDLIRWRTSLPALKGLGIRVLQRDDKNRVMVYHRYDDKTNKGDANDVVVVANFGDGEWDQYNVRMPTAGAWAVLFNSDWKGYCHDFGNIGGTEVHAAWDPTHHCNMGVLSVGPYSLLLLVPQ